MVGYIFGFGIVIVGVFGVVWLYSRAVWPAAEEHEKKKSRFVFATVFLFMVSISLMSMSYNLTHFTDSAVNGIPISHGMLTEGETYEFVTPFICGFDGFPVTNFWNEGLMLLRDNRNTVRTVQLPLQEFTKTTRYVKYEKGKLQHVNQ